jgi:hypothetical protein
MTMEKIRNVMAWLDPAISIALPFVTPAQAGVQLREYSSSPGLTR